MSEPSLARLYVLRAACLVMVLSNAFAVPRMLFAHSGMDRGVLKSLLSALWIMALLGIRYPLAILPIFLFELVWKTIWLLAFGLPQWLAGADSPQLRRDMLEIGAFPPLIAVVVPWRFLLTHYLKAPGDRWRSRFANNLEPTK